MATVAELEKRIDDLVTAYEERFEAIEQTINKEDSESLATRLERLETRITEAQGI